MNAAQRIKALLEEAFIPASVEVIDDSHKHAGHAGARPEGETHFTVRIISGRFRGVPRVERHRQVYAALRGEMAEGIHALAIDALEGEEVEGQ